MGSKRKVKEEDLKRYYLYRGYSKHIDLLTSYDIRNILKYGIYKNETFVLNDLIFQGLRNSKRPFEDEGEGTLFWRYTEQHGMETYRVGVNVKDSESLQGLPYGTYKDFYLNYVKIRAEEDVRLTMSRDSYFRKYRSSEKYIKYFIKDCLKEEDEDYVLKQFKKETNYHMGKEYDTVIV